MQIITVAFKYLKRYHLLTAGVLLSIIIASFFDGASFGMLIPLIQSMTTETAGLIEKIPFVGRLNIMLASSNRLTTISFIFILLFSLIVTKNIFLYLSNILIAKLRFSTTRDLRINLMANLLEYDIKYFDSVKTGYLISNINTETQRMGDFMLAVLQLISIATRVCAYVVLLFLISWKASIIFFVLSAVVLIPIELILRNIKKIGGHLSKAYVDYNYKLTELLNGIRVIKGSGTEELEKKEFQITADRICDFSYNTNEYSTFIIPFTEVFILGLVVLCFLILINVVKIDVMNTFPFIAAYLVVLARTLTQLNALNSQRSVAMNNLAAFTSYEEASDTRGKNTIKSGHRKIGEFSNLIEFKDVGFSYVNGKGVLNNISIRIPKGKITALVGASGVGKSTIVNLILRFYEVNSGEILVDGINLKDLSLKDWRKKIGFVSQDIFIFNTSVRDNISYGHKEISEEKIIEAAKAANAHDFILDLPDGYNTVLGERGVKLSGGQKQRISIARAIIHNPEILILDEATSSVDTETERLINEAIDRLTRGRTVIAIAHRLSTILHADNIIVLDEGKVAEEGRHAELLRRNGLYKRLYDTQFNTIQRGEE